MVVLRSLLDEFSSATGLSINFHKSTFVPLHVSQNMATAMANALVRSGASSPASRKPTWDSRSPPRSSVHPISSPSSTPSIAISQVRRQNFSVPGGRVVLINVVLGSLPIYHMSSILLPKGVRELLDAKRRSFLWAGDTHCHGSQCLVAWERVCTPKRAVG